MENGDLSQVRRLEELIMYPRETIDIEIKPWLDLNSNEDKANLAQAVLALANHGGGFVILGFQEKDNTWKPDEERPNDFKFYNQDIVNGIIQSYAEPPFHCELHLVKHRNLGVFPVIIVPGGHKVPIRSKRDGPEKKHVKQNTYYIRRPGPKSEPPQTGREWDELINRCVRANKEQMVNQFREIIYGINSVQTEKTELDTSLQIFREFIEQAKERWQSLVESELANEYPNRYSRGVWTASYQIIGDIQSIPLPQFKAVLDQVKGNETGWPPWWVPTRREIAPYVFNELIECWLKDTYSVDGAHSDFWRASPSGLMFLLRGYQEDSEAKGVEPGTIFDLTLPVWRTGECLLHAERLSAVRVSVGRRRRAWHRADRRGGAPGLPHHALFLLQHPHQSDGLVLAASPPAHLEASRGGQRERAHGPADRVGRRPGNRLLGAVPDGPAVPDLRRFSAGAVWPAHALALVAARPADRGGRDGAGRGGAAALVCGTAAEHSRVRCSADSQPGGRAPGARLPEGVH